MSILDNRPALAACVGQIAEAAGYLWQKGWAERNGGNITVNITEYVDDGIRNMPAISAVFLSVSRCPTSKGAISFAKALRRECAILPAVLWRTVR